MKAVLHFFESVVSTFFGVIAFLVYWFSVLTACAFAWAVGTVVLGPVLGGPLLALFVFFKIKQDN